MDTQLLLEKLTETNQALEKINGAVNLVALIIMVILLYKFIRFIMKKRRK